MKDDLNLIRVLVALDQHRRVGLAARALGITQPGLSNALKRLRATHDDPLFVRSPRGMQPTPKGQQLVDAAREMLELYKTRMLGDSAFVPESTPAEFRLAMSDVGEMVFLPRIIEHLRVHAPQATVRCAVVPPSELTVALEDGRLDLAIGYFPDLSGGNIFQQKLFSHGFVCLVRANHPLVGRKVTRRQFLELGHAAVHAEGRSQEVLEQYLRRKRIRRRVVLDVPHFMSIPYVIASSDLIVTVPLAVGTAFASTVGRLKVLDAPFDIPRFDLKQHWHRRFHKDSRSRWLRSQISQLFNEKTDEWRELKAVDG
jgi:DNA-binding transcriptional LysR family regulator